MNKLNQIVFVVCCVGMIISPSTSLTQPVDPLIIDRNDPLIPQGYGRRELSSFEKYRIQKEIALLDKTAQDELDLGNVSSAMETWYRRLRLTRIIGTKAEIKALGRIGAIAWEESLSTDVRNIADRLIAIQTDNKNKKLSPELSESLASAYESIRYLDKAIDVYQQVLAIDKKSENKLLDKLGELYLGIFDYQNAATVYKQKLAKNARKDRQETILKTLIYIYDRAGKTNQSITAKQQLIKQYTNQNKSKKTLSLEIAIARDYETLKQDNKAIEFYNKAFKTASESQQLAIASEALIGMGKLYQKEENLEQAIDIYNKLLSIQQQSYNYYGQINSYDTLGNIYLELNKKELAKESFQKGLNLAKTINYKADYFRDRIKE